MFRGLWGDTEVAVKKLKLIANDDIVQSVIHEAKLLASLRHINIIRLLGTFSMFICSYSRDLYSSRTFEYTHRVYAEGKRI